LKKDNKQHPFEGSDTDSVFLKEAYVNQEVPKLLDQLTESDLMDLKIFEGAYG